MTIRRISPAFFLAMLTARCLAGDLEQLLEGVAKIAAPGAPGSLCVFGERAFAVVAGGAGGALRQPVVAATTLGQGRIVAFGHDGYFAADALAAADTGRVMLNALYWAARKPHAEARVAVRRQGGLLAFLKKQGLKAEALDDSDWYQKLGDFDVLCCHANELGGSAGRALAAFQNRSGGIVAADTAWGWLQLHPGKTLLADHTGNCFVAAGGLVWADGMAERTDPAGFAANVPIPPLVHAGRALDALAAGDAKLKPEEVAQASWTLTHAARSLLPNDKLLLPRLRQLEQTHSASAIPTPQKPLTMREPLARVLLTLQVNELQAAPPEQVKAHPAAAGFPGSVPEKAERVTRTVEVDCAVPAWHSTGLYAPPGELLTVEVPQGAAGKGLWVRIGAHSDTIWHHDAWHRVPDICRRFPLNASLTKAANAFGGPVYIEVPGGCKLGTLAVKIAGAVEASLYVLGKTDLAAWRETIRRH